MAIIRKQKATSEAGPSATTRQRRADPPPLPPPLTPPLPPEARTSYYTRKCKLGPLLRREFTLYKSNFQLISEEFSVLRRDAINFALLIQVELVATYTRNLGDIQRRLRQLNHDLRLAQELQDELLSLQQTFNDISDAQGGLQDLPWQNESILLMDQLIQLQQNFEQLNTVVNEIMVVTDNQEIANQNAENIQTLHNRLTEISGNTEPITTLVRRTVANLLLRVRQWKLDLQNELPEHLERLNLLERQAIQNLRMIANLRELHQLVLQTLQTVQNILRQNDLTEEARLEQIQILTVTCERIAVTENQLRIVQPIEQQSQNTLNNNEAARELVLDPSNLNATIRFSPHILNNFNDFEVTRREPGLDTYRYAIPTLDPLHRNLSNAYGSTIVQTNKAANGIINHILFDEIVFEEEEEENIELLHFQMHQSSYEVYYLRLLIQWAHQNGHPVPRFMIPNGNFFRLTGFDCFYFGHENKMHLWNTVFNIGKLDTGVLANSATSHLACSMKTDGHMISILFENTSVEFVPQAKKDLIRQKKNVDFTNRTKGLYPLYKEPTGITANDRIIGIDPGVRDIIYAVDCDVDELVDKRSTKQHSFAYSNASYKLRSGMNWIKQKELASRLNSDIQASYDQLKTRNTYTNQGVMDFLHSIALTHNKSRRKCLDEEGRILHWSSRCPERRAVRQNNIIYPLKLCNQCPVNGNNDLYWQRDVNVATNIRSVLIEYIRSNFNIHSQPAALSRGQQDQGN
ncbi:hypothetical protein CU097_010712 [Rhizopus azygosporus]|uniref:Uncharacterized protein n=1 Tax=Rhizopus azygosporus TaxID=86630 RepID=A0A367JKM9_RHIAZ|nr:hypothetical protein CU097_010712 [Rhizopus azygosporus]